VAAPGLHRFIVPLSLLVLTALFAAQRFGTAGVGRFFGPVTTLWFAVLALLGLVHIIDNPQVLVALLPHHALGFMRAPAWPSWRWARWCCASPAPRRCTPTWATSASCPSGWPGSRWCGRRWC
jgi:hypothetical protein